MASGSLRKVFGVDGTDSGSFAKPKPARGRLLRSQSEAKDTTVDSNNNEPKKTLRRSLSNKNVATLQRTVSVDNFVAVLPPQLRRSVSNLSESVSSLKAVFREFDWVILTTQRIGHLNSC